MTRVMRQKNGWTRSIRSIQAAARSGDAVLTNEKLPRVASRGRKVEIWRQNRLGVNGRPRRWAEHLTSYQSMEYADKESMVGARAHKLNSTGNRLFVAPDSQRNIHDRVCLVGAADGAAGCRRVRRTLLVEATGFEAHRVRHGLDARTPRCLL